MFTGFMANAWIVATMVAVVAGVVGFFTVLRGSAFVAHAVPQAGFAGAAGASLIGVSTFLGLGTFAVISALSIGLLGKRGRHDAMTALTLVFMLGLGALFLSWSEQYRLRSMRSFSARCSGSAPTRCWRRPCSAWCASPPS